jgi:hypothetical protein
MPRVIPVIEVVTTRGRGVEADPVRQVIQYWTLDGKFLAENDPEALTASGKEVTEATR